MTILQYLAPGRWDTVKEASLFRFQLHRTHCHLPFVTHHWHWLSSAQFWRLWYLAELMNTTIAPPWPFRLYIFCCTNINSLNTYELVAAPPCETSVEAATLAAGRPKNYVQAKSVDAPHPYWTSTTIPVRLCIHSYCCQWQIPAEINWFRDLRSAKNKN